MYTIYYNCVDGEGFLISYMAGDTIYATKELAKQALRTQYGNNSYCTIEKLKIIE